jgi:hypothetical protein
MATIKITIESERHRGRGPAFIATLPDGSKTRASVTPFCHAAREALRLNIATRDDTLEMYREGVLCLTSSIDTAAGLTVNEGVCQRPYFGRWQAWNDDLSGE